MDKIKYIILGAGPTGLTLANKLLEKGEKSFLVIERESEVGGLCRSQNVDGSALDIGGGHFLDVRRPKVNEFLFKFMPLDEWNYFERDSRISIGNIEINHPFEANIWQMPVEKQVEYLKSIAIAGCNIGKDKPEKFIDWITWKLGDKIANDYMIPYNKKMFADNLNELGTYWLDKLPNVSFEDTIMSCLNKKSYGVQPGHACFYYPKKYGYGEVWRRMGEALGDKLVLNAAVKSIDIQNRIVTYGDSSIQAECIFTTIPWHTFEILNVDKEFLSSVKKLKSSSIEVRYFDNTMDTKAQWIYYPDEKLPYHRILVRSNFCENSKGYWTETRIERTPLFDNEALFAYVNEYAYPLNTVDKPQAINYILDYAKRHNIIGVGRWGEHQHYNSDVVVQRAMDLIDELA